MKTQPKSPKNTKSNCLEKVKNIVQIVTIILATMWGYATFVHPEIFRPNDHKPHLNLEARMELIETFPDRAIVNLSMYISNDSKRFIHILGAGFTVGGLKFQLDKIDFKRNYVDLKEKVKILNSINPSEKPIYKHWTFGRRNYLGVISGGNIVPDNYWFAPREKYSRTITMTVPCEVDTLEANLYILNHHGDKRKFSRKWLPVQNQTLWPQLQVKAEEKFVPINEKQHRKLLVKNGVRLSLTSTEISIPRRQEPNTCGGNSD